VGDLNPDGTRRYLPLPPFEVAVAAGLFAGAPPTYNYLRAPDVSSAVFGEPAAPILGSLASLADARLAAALRVGVFSSHAAAAVAERRAARMARWAMRLAKMSS
jgi:hypothetical protein